jgi:hypothetical protein
MNIDIDLKNYNFTDGELKALREKQEEKLERYLKCYNEQTERTLKYINNIELEMMRRIQLNYANHDNIILD